MKHPISQALQKSLSRAFPNSAIRQVVQTALLITVGVLAMVLHARLRIPLHLPGKQGLLYMFLVMSVCLVTTVRFSAVIATASSSALLLTGFGAFTDPYMPVYYLALGFILDLLIGNKRSNRSAVYFLAFAGGIAFMSIPLMRAFVSLLTGFPYGSLMQGILFPVVTHFLFGSAGSLLAVLAVKQLPKD